jgi:hypothetical protein
MQGLRQPVNMWPARDAPAARFEPSLEPSICTKSA